MTKSKPFPLDRQIVLIEDAIYTKYDLSDVSDEDFVRFTQGNGAVDAFCHVCDKPSVFQIDGVGFGFSDKAKEITKSGIVSIKCRCGRHANSLHGGCRAEMHICFYRDFNSLIKIGQYPSKAELDFGSLDPVFSKELDKELRHELGKAIGLRAHGIGIGSFVYLRRIFERLINEAHQKAIQMEAWDEPTRDSFKTGRISDRINLLKDYLPNRLVRNSALYGILSKGVHELSETECLQYFDLVKNAILMILKQRYEERENDRIVKDLAAASASISTEARMHSQGESV